MNFRHALNKISSGWQREEQPSFQAVLKTSWKGYNLSDRNRFEYRMKEDAKDLWRYRNLLTINAPWKWTRYEIRPYFSDEFFAVFDSEKINENRLCGGVSFKFTKNIGLDVFHMWRRVKASKKWATNDILGTRLRIDF